MDKEIPEELVGEYGREISKLINSDDIPVVYHYGWTDYKRKAEMSKFWAKMKRHYQSDGKGTREGSWLNKSADDITQDDVDLLIRKYYKQKKLIPLNISRHPQEVLAWAKECNLNQHELFTAAKLNLLKVLA